MSQPLGDAIGNALDVAAAVARLRGEEGGRLRELVVAFVARAATAELGVPAEEAEAKTEHVLSSGEALDRFRRMVEAQGGDPRVADDPEGVLPRAPVVVALASDRGGTLASVDAEELGLASGALGAGRVRKGDPIDPAVGIVFHAKVGDPIEEGAPIGEIHATSSDAADEARSRVLAALTFRDGPVEPPPLVHGWVVDGGGG
jgi:pyrimidine-nucleoside phosphorylase